MLVFIESLALAEKCQMSTHVPGFQSFFIFLHHFLMAKLATSSIRVSIVRDIQSTLDGSLSVKQKYNLINLLGQ